ncbi:MAG: 23S rRNA (adenine(2503)-C(2))-methyltransferase RlmN [Yaniella sp.]|uniref:23S rRNA (adenine(2503)-C(2))-methyltransferase RlmN n=1 Tax=Yaniella sp. TaxID=2773929 RepID=UPI002647F647|nr:23S rRNA (adenine(2503)-C(2))-methyltransferase RlmN [Yaniella sp.]MDN5815169.1 23S rRNA (adenine(2503)-C(2))-methyltransferase RlmN [Yaniella sp.]MDN5839054.1 23S rRNA (adenine(2503)-C(2))-methyltransferase RlmN [Yaniella sp.]MDN6457232.1 23S rRNA (adenine(2503)-C(2))-methyltransferase RlmN [Yaniella sp.]MDN6678588.1 23S rRNA (adenine(2503)-C(2))-methyltransferase RlmN [Yaniella sp.]MDN6758123.1 23S rRNA (adenine(2503)-C(2))-methyltransferase RlmN [Yaniella sp.]
MADKYTPRKPGTRPMKPQTDRAGRLKLNPPRKQFLDPEVEQLTEERARLANHGVRPRMERPQVRPRTEGWEQRTDDEGRPKLEFKQPRVTQPAQHLADMTMSEREEKVKELGLPAFRARQLSTHYFSHYTTDPADMTDLPADKRDELAETFFPHLLTEVRRIETEDRQTIKFLWKLFDGVLVESVLMRYQNRITLCVSSQAGCGMNCPFCATGQAGLTRNLSTAEIVDQIVAANRVIADGQLGKPEGARDIERVSNVVFMGMGEPLANYRRVMNSIHRMVDDAPEGLGMSARNITVSTVGLVPAINKLAAEGIPVTFALSLHAPDNELRDQMIPVNSRWDADEALDAAHNYYIQTGRRVSIEYALIKDMNDHGWRADLLAKKIKARGRGWAHINPIPLNPTPGSVWTASEPDVTQEFIDRLNDAGVPTTLRDTRGKEIDGACGQLAAEDD